MKKRILFVDDEPLLLELYRIVFAQDEKDWEVCVASGGEEALRLMEKDPVDVIVSDMRMPGMNGADLVREVMRRHPRTSRLIMSGCSDHEVIAKCLAATHQFLPKPCDFKALRNTIWRVCSLDNWMLDEKLKTLVAQFYTLPSLPSLYFKIMTALESSDTSVDDVGRIVAQDPAMTAKILQLVNSAFFGIARKISNPSEAVQFLGVGKVRSLVLSLQVFSCFDQQHFKNFSIDRVWKHSLSTGAVAQKIARMQKADVATVDDAYVAGMLHDIGKVMLASSLHEAYERAFAMVQTKKMTLPDAEREVFGVSHAEVGAYLLGLWGLPVTIVEAIALHHSPRDSAVKVFSPLTAVHIANVLEAEINSSAEIGSVPVFDMDYLAELGLEDRVDDWREAARQVLGEAR